jgi:hydrogenase nickel incorporation protein HypA/HybF
MHELSLIADLLNKIEAVAREQQARKVVAVTVRLGALTHLSPEHFQEHFAHASHGTLAEGARLDIQLLTDPADPQAQELLLESVEVEQ